MNGSANGHADVDEEGRPVKKFKAEDGSAMEMGADWLNDPDDTMDDDQDGADDAEDQTLEDDEDEGDDDVEDEEDDQEDESENVVGDAEDEVAVGGVRDEALDDPGSDSD